MFLRWPSAFPWTQAMGQIQGQRSMRCQGSKNALGVGGEKGGGLARWIKSADLGFPSLLLSSRDNSAVFLPGCRAETGQGRPHWLEGVVAGTPEEGSSASKSMCWRGTSWRLEGSPSADPSEKSSCVADPVWSFQMTADSLLIQLSANSSWEPTMSQAGCWALL